MAIPQFQAIMLPLLRVCADGVDHRFPEVRDKLAEEFELTPEERTELLASGTQSRFDNRVRWAKQHLTTAQLFEAPSWGVFRITERGREVLARDIETIAMSDLLEFSEYAEWRGVAATDDGDTEEEHERTPQELIDASYRTLRRDLEDAVLQRVKSASPQFFERLVVELLVAMGYGGSRQEAAAAVGGRGDGGIDGFINEDTLGLDTVYVQAKRWEQGVGRPIVQAFAGALEGRRARKGVLLTTSSFSGDARDYVTQIEKRIVLIDGRELARLMVDHGVGVRRVETYVLNDIADDFFEDEVTPSTPQPEGEE